MFKDEMTEWAYGKDAVKVMAKFMLMDIGRNMPGPVICGGVFSMGEFDCMKLPTGKHCSDCAHFQRCSEVLGIAKRGYTACDFYPSRYVEGNKYDLRNCKMRRVRKQERVSGR